MTSAPDPVPGPAGAASEVPEAAAGGADGEVDVRCPGWQRPASATWLVVTEVDGPAGEVFTARTVAGPQPRAFGGDVLLRVVPASVPEANAVVSVAVWAVAAGALVPVAAWNLPGDGGWPERVRATVVFAMSALTVLGEHVDLGECDPVGLDCAAGTAVPGLPQSLAPDGRVAAVG